MMRQRAQERKNDEMEVMEVEEEGKSGEESESESEYEEYTDSEDEAEPRLKPVFIRKYELKPETNALEPTSCLYQCHSNSLSQVSVQKGQKKTVSRKCLLKGTKLSSEVPRDNAHVAVGDGAGVSHCFMCALPRLSRTIMSHGNIQHILEA